MPSTGSGRRQNYRYAPTSRMTNTFIADGEDENVIAGMQSGLYAKKMGGGSVNPLTGEFNFAVQEGYLVKTDRSIGRYAALPSSERAARFCRKSMPWKRAWDGRRHVRLHFGQRAYLCRRAADSCQRNPCRRKGGPVMLDICKKLVNEALCQGADAADCIASATEGISADIYEGQVDSFQKARPKGSVFVFSKKGRVGYAYTERLEGAERIVAQALSAAEVTDRDEYACIYQAAQRYASEQPGQTDLSPVVSQQIVDKALALYHAVMALPHVENVQGCSAEMEKTYVYFANSAGTEGSASRQNTALFVDAVAKIGDWTDSGWSFAIGKTLEEVDEHQVAKRAQEKAIQYYQAGRTQNGAMPIIFHGRQW